MKPAQESASPRPETPEEAADRFPALAERSERLTARDIRNDRLLLWREIAVVLVVAALLVARAIWLV